MRYRPPRTARHIRPALKMGVGLGRGGASSAAPTAPSWPTTNLLVAYDFGNAVPTSGTLTSWPKTAGSGGATLTPTGTVTNSATGVSVSSSYVSDIGVTMGAAAANFTFYFVANRAGGSDNLILSAGILAGNGLYLGYSGATFYVISSAGAGLTSATSKTGLFAGRIRRSSAGTIFLKLSGSVEETLGLAVDAYTFQLQTIGGRPWVPDYSASTAKHLSLAYYSEDTVGAGTSTAIETEINDYYGVTP